MRPRAPARVRVRASVQGAAVAVACSVVVAASLIAASPSAGAATAGPAGVSTIVGGGGTTALTSGISSLTASLGSPLSAVFDAQGNVVFADQDNNVVRVAAQSTGTFYGHAMTAGRLYTIVGNGVAGDIGDGSSKPLTTAELSGPSAVAIDAQGDMAITDTNDDAVRFVAAVGGVRYGQVMTAGEIFTVAGGGQEGNITPGGSASSAGLTGPDGVAFDAEGDLIVADTGNDLIRFIPAVARTVFGMAVQPGHIYTIAGNMNYGYTGDGGLGSSAELQLDTFNGVAVDANGDALFSDVDNQVVRLVAAATGTAFGRSVIAGHIYTIAGNGTEGFKGDKKPATKAWLDTPQGLAVDAAGDLFISDSANNLIRLVPSVTGHYDGMAVKADDIYTIAGSAAGPFNSPAGVSVGANGDLLVADNGDNVIREITGTPPSQPTVTAIKPTSGPSSGDRKVTISGTDLSGTTAVLFGSRPATTFTVRSAKKIIAYSPVGTLGTVIIRVYSPTGVSVATSPDTYTYDVAATTKHKRRS